MLSFNGRNMIILACGITSAYAISYTDLICRTHQGQELCHTAANSTEHRLECYVQKRQTWCYNGLGEEFLRAESSLTTSESPVTTANSTTANSSNTKGRSCHFHAGVEHCVGGEDEEKDSCEATKRTYGIPYRVGALFTVLATSAIAVFLPLLLAKWTKTTINSLIFICFKQFGTGVVISTALVHLYTHASLTFASECLPHLDYEATTSSIVMAGSFLSFLLEYACQRHAALDKETREHNGNASTSGERVMSTKTIEIGARSLSPLHESDCSNRIDNVSVLVVEAGIIFHSITIGLTTVLAGDSGFTTLFIVTIFHQIFEGLALSSRIAESRLNFKTKMIGALCFALITPIGMGIGLGVLHKFNGNDATTLVIIGTLDALSAGILLWVGLVELLAATWIHGEMKHASLQRCVTGGSALICGMAFMSFLGKWA